MNKTWLYSICKHMWFFLIYIEHLYNIQLFFYDFLLLFYEILHLFLWFSTLRKLDLLDTKLDSLDKT